MFGTDKRKSAKTMTASKGTMLAGDAAGYGGHFRAVQGFRYYGERGLK
jgi:hypothetical protein